MASQQQKNILKGFIIQATSHNKFLEESEMWKQRYEEVVEDTSVKDSNVLKLEKQFERKNKTCQNDDYRCVKLNDTPKTIGRILTNGENDKWKHDGFESLYPNTVVVAKRRLSTFIHSSTTTSDSETSGNAKKHSKKKKKEKKKSSKKKKKHKKHKKA